MTGTVGSRILRRSVIRHVGKGDFPGTGVGDDFMVLEKEQGLVAAEGSASSGEPVLQGLSVTETALLRGENQLFLSGRKAESLLVILSCGGETEEERIRQEMNALTDTCRRRNLSIRGGNTWFTGTKDIDCTAHIVVFGRERSAHKIINQSESGVGRPGFCVMQFGMTGDYGREVLRETKGQVLKSQFSESFIRKAAVPAEEFSLPGRWGTLPDRMIRQKDITLHDGTFGGIYRGAWEMAEKSGCGIRLIHEKILIRQETIEIAEALDINPYLLCSTGMLLAACSAEMVDFLCQAAAERHIPASVIGELTKEKERVVVSGGETAWKRSLTLYEEDPMFSVRQDKCSP